MVAKRFLVLILGLMLSLGPGAVWAQIQNEVLASTDLEISMLDFLQQRSRGVFTVQEIYNRRDEVIGGYALGLSEKGGAYETHSKSLQLITWPWAYAEFAIDWQREPDHSERFLQALSWTGKAVVFFVPKSIQNYQHPSVTKAELLWYLKNPHKMKNVYFVFGAYDRDRK